MLRLPLLNLQCRETNRLPATEINNKLGCGGLYGGSYLPLELKQIPQVSDGKFVVYYGSDFYGELPPNHNLQSRNERKPTFLLVKADGCKEQVIDEGEVERNLRIHGGNKGIGYVPWGHFIATGRLLGRFSFYCSSPDIFGVIPTTRLPHHTADTMEDSVFTEIIDQLAGKK